MNEPIGATVTVTTHIPLASGAWAHRAPIPEEEPIPGDEPVPEEDPVPHPDPVVREPVQAPPMELGRYH